MVGWQPSLHSLARFVVSGPTGVIVGVALRGHPSVRFRVVKKVEWRREGGYGVRTGAIVFQRLSSREEGRPRSAAPTTLPHLAFR